MRAVVRDELIRQVRVGYADGAAALEDAGLSEADEYVAARADAAPVADPVK